MRGRKLFDNGLSRKLVLTRHVATPAGYLLLDFQVDNEIHTGPRYSDSMPSIMSV
jgi:hypothetical protein